MAEDIDVVFKEAPFMHTLLEDTASRLAEIVVNFDIIAVLIASGLSIAAALVSALGRSLSEGSKVGESTTFEQTLDLTKDTRLDELRSRLRTQIWVRRLNSLSSNFLTFGQYVIGGLLASSFVQQSLSSNIIGLLGILVLFSSLIYQRFRPDIQAELSLQRAVSTKKIIRDIEDRIFELKNQRDGAIDLFAIRERASRGLSALEDSELEAARQLRDALDEVSR